MKVTIVGRVDLNDIQGTTKRFTDAQIELMRHGFDANSIVKSSVQWLVDKSIEAKERLKLVTESHAIYVLPDWGEDKIAMLEVALAHTLGKKVVCQSNTILSNRITFYNELPEYTF